MEVDLILYSEGKEFMDLTLSVLFKDISSWS